MENIRIVTFDTSAHNRLTADDGSLAEPILEKIKSSMRFRFAGISLGEIYATKNPTGRSVLLTSCRRLLEGESDCIPGPDEVLRLLVEAHVKDPTAFDWTTTEVLSPEWIQEVSSGDLANDELLIETQRNEHKARLKEFKQMFNQHRPSLQTAFEGNGEVRPKTFRKFLDFQEKSDVKLMAGLCKGIYDRVAGTKISEESFLEFLAVCPPFRAFNYAMHMSNFNLAVRHEDGERFEFGFNDLSMAIYLPYCDTFVTAEKMAEQEKCLREIAFIAGLGTEIMSYDKFCKTLR